VLPTQSGVDGEGCVDDELDEWEWEFDLDPTIDEDDAIDVAQLCPTNAHRNSCLAHLLQLAIKDAIQSSELVKEVTAKVNSIVSYFNKSPQRHVELMKLTSGLRMIKPVATRWNSLHNSMHRMRRVVNKEVKKKQKHSRMLLTKRKR